MKIKSVLLIRVKSSLIQHAGCATLLSYEIQQRHLSITKTQDIALACAGGLLRILFGENVAYGADLAFVPVAFAVSSVQACSLPPTASRISCFFNQDIFAWARYMPCGRSQRLGHGRHAKRHRVRGKSPQRHGCAAAFANAIPICACT